MPKDISMMVFPEEKKKNEILQMMVLQPELAILDETDSGLDIEAVNRIPRHSNVLNERDALLSLTHHREIFEYINLICPYIIGRANCPKLGCLPDG